MRPTVRQLAGGKSRPCFLSSCLQNRGPTPPRTQHLQPRIWNPILGPVPLLAGLSWESCMTAASEGTWTGGTGGKKLSSPAEPTWDFSSSSDLVSRNHSAQWRFNLNNQNTYNLSFIPRGNMINQRLLAALFNVYDQRVLAKRRRSTPRGCSSPKLKPNKENLLM